MQEGPQLPATSSRQKKRKGKKTKTHSDVPPVDSKKYRSCSMSYTNSFCFDVLSYSSIATEGCGKIEDATHKFQQCAKCGVPYCSRECQLKDWKEGSHRVICLILAPAKPSPTTNQSIVSKPQEGQQIVRATLRKFIQYVSPFALFGFQHKGYGISNRF